MRLKQARRIGPAALGTSVLVVLGTLTATAAPVTAAIDTVGTAGTLGNGVSWTSTTEFVDHPTGGAGGTPGVATSVWGGDTGTVTFSEPVDVTFDVWSLQTYSATQIECVTVPAGFSPTSLHPMHVWDAATRTLCGRPENGAGDDAVAARTTFAASAQTQFTIAANTQGPGTRGISNVQVTVDRAAAELVDDSDSTVMDTPVTVDAQANDTIPEGSTGWEVDTTSTEGGTVVDNGDGTVTYTPPAGFVGTDTFTYRVTGPDGVEHEATVTITVTEDGEPSVPMVAPGMAAAALVGAGLFTAIRRRRRA